MSIIELILKIRNTLNFSKHFLDLKGNDGTSFSPLTKQKICRQSPIHISFRWASHSPAAENVVGQGLAAASHPENGPQQLPGDPFPQRSLGGRGPQSCWSVTVTRSPTSTLLMRLAMGINHTPEPQLDIEGPLLASLLPACTHPSAFSWNLPAGSTC